ncbi:5'-methylthioadenosine/S-adenosylhomocysteine nucleosidase, partial [Phocaeicola vulgatus]
MKIGIITAMSSEQKQVAQLLENKKEYTEGPFQYTEGSIRNNTIILMKCGIGKVNAAAGTVELIRTFQPDCVISTGVAGGIDSCLKIMDVVVSRQIVYHDVWCGEGNMYGQIQGLPARFEGNATLFDCAMSLDTPTAIHGGLICSGDKFITDRSELNDIK